MGKGIRLLVNGRVCTGKDFISDYIIENYGFEKVTFAKPIYSIAKNLFGMKEKNRTLLISIGDKMREIDADVFVKCAIKNLDENKNYIVSDCRRENEHRLCTEAGFYPIRVRADFDVRVKRAIARDGKRPNTEEWEGHSETGADNCEYKLELINNEDSPEKLVKQIDEFMFNTFGLTKINKLIN